MLKKTVKYTDYNNVEQTEDLYFNLTEAEIIEMEMNTEGGLSAAFERIIKAKDGRLILAEFKKILLSAYGERTPDGKRFSKSDQLREEFEQSAAYSALFFELATDAEAATTFINGLLPAGLTKIADKNAAQVESTPPSRELPEDRMAYEEFMAMRKERAKED